MNNAGREPAVTPDEPAPQIRHVATTVHGRFLVAPPSGRTAAKWLIGFHGYGHNGDIMLELLRRVPGADDWMLVSVQGLHPFYSRSNEVIANWMTRQDRDHAIADNVAYVDAVVADLKREFGVPAVLVFAGFSQGVAMAYRAGLLGHHYADAIVAVGGDLPPELAPQVAHERAWPRVMAVTGTRDEFYSPRRLDQDLAVMKGQGAVAHRVVHDGGHDWSQDVCTAIGAWLATIAAGVKP